MNTKNISLTLICMSFLQPIITKDLTIRDIVALKTEQAIDTFQKDNEKFSKESMNSNCINIINNYRLLNLGNKAIHIGMKAYGLEQITICMANDTLNNITGMNTCHKVVEQKLKKGYLKESTVPVWLEKQLSSIGLADLANKGANDLAQLALNDLEATINQIAQLDVNNPEIIDAFNNYKNQVESQ